MVNNENSLMQKVLLEHIYEQRRARRWGIFFKLITLVFLAIILLGVFNKDLKNTTVAQDHTAVIDIIGEISASHTTNADNIRKALKSAFESKFTKGVVLRINSPGGSPVQARLIYDEIRYLRSKHPQIKIYAAIEEIGASAAYLIASATDEIYADQTSIVGSIGVKIDSFGFVEGMQKIGVERRAYAAGAHKEILDPFLPRNAEDDAFINEQLRFVHQAFIDNVKQGRGSRLKEIPEIFSGLFWCGEPAKNLGLIDGYGDAQKVAREIIKVEKIVDYSPTEGVFDRFAHRMGSSIGQAFTSRFWGQIWN